MAQVQPRPLQPPKILPRPEKAGQEQLSLSVPLSTITTEKEIVNSCLPNLSDREGEDPTVLFPATPLPCTRQYLTYNRRSINSH